MPGERRLLLKEEACRRKQGTGCYTVARQALIGMDESTPAPETARQLLFPGILLHYHMPLFPPVFLFPFGSFRKRRYGEIFPVWAFRSILKVEKPYATGQET